MGLATPPMSFHILELSLKLDLLDQFPLPPKTASVLKTRMCINAIDFCLVYTFRAIRVRRWSCPPHLSFVGCKRSHVCSKLSGRKWISGFGCRFRDPFVWIDRWKEPRMQQQWTMNQPGYSFKWHINRGLVVWSSTQYPKFYSNTYL